MTSLQKFLIKAILDGGKGRENIIKAKVHVTTYNLSLVVGWALLCCVVSLDGILCSSSSLSLRPLYRCINGYWRYTAGSTPVMDWQPILGGVANKASTPSCKILIPLSPICKIMRSLI